MKRILFIIPPFIQPEELDNHYIQDKLPVLTAPYGILSMATYLQANAPECIVDILDLNQILISYYKTNQNTSVELDSIIIRKLDTFQPEFVGISCLFNTTYPYLGLISQSIKKWNPSTFILVGGGLATNLAPRLLSDFPDLDGACFGEGERPLLDLVIAEQPQQAIECHPSWITKTSILMGRVPQATPVEDLDSIPPINYNLIDLDEYQGRSLDRSRTTVRREFSIHTSRGCPFRCVFCSNGKVHGKKVRKMSSGRVLSDIRAMIAQKGIGIVLIEDDHFLADRARAKDILRGLVELDVNIEFPNGMAVYAIDDEIGALLKAAGATTVCLAVESGSEFVLRRIIHKPHTTAMISRATAILRTNGLLIHAFFVVGLPGEQEIHRQETMSLIRDVGFDWSYFFIATPIVGSELYEICEKNGYLIQPDFSKHEVSKANIRTLEIDPEYIEERVYLMNLEANFICNYNSLHDRKQIAMRYFQTVVDRYPNQAIAHWAIARLLKSMGTDSEKQAVHQFRWITLQKENPSWNIYISKLHNLIPEPYFTDTLG